MRASYLFTSESVSEGHPDKVSRSDFRRDPRCLPREGRQARHCRRQCGQHPLGCETLCTTNKIVIAGEGRGQLFRDIHGVSVVDRELISEIARGVVKDIGYDQNGFS